MSSDATRLLTDLLRQVSRSFYTTLRVLPGGVRRQISLAYLLARATDTIADTALVPLEQRLAALRLLRERIQGLHDKPLDLGRLAQQQGTPAERLLLERAEDALAILSGFEPRDQQLIRDVLQIITSGQELDLTRFAGASAENIIALQTGSELDDYTYRVAGCVGEFWTKMCRAHLFPAAVLDDAGLLADGVRFGKGLQLVNILRDLSADLRQGRCYLPADRLKAINLRPCDLLQREAEPSLRPLYDSYLHEAAEHLAAGWRYTEALPRSGVRVRLACAWPILIGVRTLGRLRVERVLDAGQRVKIRRAEVRRVFMHSLLLYPFPDRWRRLFEREVAGAAGAEPGR
jgi:farnesyl-diphosphate farnesyltransferase